MNGHFDTVTCTPPNLENGQISYNDSQATNGEYPVDTKASFTWKYGYSLFGSESSTCSTSGNWKEETPICNLSIKNNISL